MRAACCEATVLRHEVIVDDIRLLTALWPDREHAPHAGQFFTLRAWGADEAPFLSRPISVHKWDAEGKAAPPNERHLCCLCKPSAQPASV